MGKKKKKGHLAATFGPGIMVQHNPMDKFIIPAHSSDEPGIPCHTGKQENYQRYQI